MNIILPICLTYVLGAQNNHLTELVMVLLCPHSIWPGREIRNLFCDYVLLSIRLSICHAKFQDSNERLHIMYIDDQVTCSFCISAIDELPVVYYCQTLVKF